jgi:phage portal protein BeeE
MSNYSKRIERSAKKVKLTVDEMAMADLTCLGYSDMDAYLITHQDQKIRPDAHNEEQIKQIVTSPEFLSYVKSRKRAMLRASTKIENEGSPAEITDALPDKDQVARELLAIINALPAASKERADVWVKYTDLLQMKKDEVKEEDTTHYYLPVTCDKCTLYQEFKSLKASKS